MIRRGEYGTKVFKYGGTYWTRYVFYKGGPVGYLIDDNFLQVKSDVREYNYETIGPTCLTTWRG